MALQLTDEMISTAQKQQKETGIPASVILAQIVLESSGNYSGGMSKLAANENNLFGVKSTKQWEQNGGKSSQYMTTEYINGKATPVLASFRSYDSVTDSMNDHLKVITQSRYTKQFEGATTPEDYAKGLQAGGYATDPYYASKLMNIINSRNLTQYDSGSNTVYSGGFSSDGSFVGTSDSTGRSGKDTEYKPTKLDFFGSIVKVVCIIIVLMLAVVFFMKAFEQPIAGVAKKIVKKKVPASKALSKTADISE